MLICSVATQLFEPANSRAQMPPSSLPPIAVNVAVDRIFSYSPEHVCPKDLIGSMRETHNAHRVNASTKALSIGIVVLELVKII